MDTLDKRILRALQKDGRVPFTHIARQVGVSETTIRTRYQRMVQQGIVRTTGVLDPYALDYEATAMVAVSVEPGMADAIAKGIAHVPEVSHLVRTLGSYDLIVQVFCKHLSHLTDVVTHRIQPIPGVRATETLMIAESYKLPCDWYPQTDTGAGDEADQASNE
jgi:Lrp/AsnC family transcriptional regulator for asnA, asnC and gidA